MATRRNTGAAKKTRRTRSVETKQEIVRRAIASLREDPQWSLNLYARSVGIYPTMLRQWLNAFGKPYGWKGSVVDFDRSKPAPAALSIPVEGANLAEPSEASSETSGEASLEPSAAPAAAPPMAPPASAWAEKFGGELLAAMGVEGESTSSETLISSGEPPKRKIGRPTDAERALRKEREEAERELARSGLGLSKVPFDPRPRRVTVEPPREDEQPGLFDNHHYVADPVHREHREPTHNDLVNQSARQALKERDAMMTVLQMLIRDNGGKLPGA